jgi:ubiquinone/menaquinone biosynthesis C-methylase UbiE
MRIDWGDGDYARTARVLAPAAEALLDAAGISVGQRVLDVACGTGNATLAAASRGAVATGLDAAERLVAEAQERADAAGVSASFIVQDAEQLPVADGAFDATLSVFGVIFAEPEAAIREMFRVTAPTGLVGLTVWREEGPIAAAGRILRDAMPGEIQDVAHWEDLEWIEGLLLSAGARVMEVSAGTVVMEAGSPEEWFAEQEDHHPVWRALRRELGEQVWSDVRTRSVAALAEGNEAPGAFRATSPYRIVIARR